MPLKLRHKINGAIIVTFLLIAAVFSAIQLPFQQHRLQTAINSIEILLQTLVDRDMEELANEIFDDRSNAIKIRLKQMMKVKGVLAIAVFDTSGKLLSSEGTLFKFQNMGAGEIDRIRSQPNAQKKRWQGHAGLLFSREIDFLGEHLGFIRIYYSLSEVERNQRGSFLIFGSLLVSILLVMLIVLNLILSKAILKPIQYLRDAAQRIAQGNLDLEISMPRKDELGNLAESFENMRDSIIEKISDFRRLSTILESTSDLVSISTPDAQLIYLNRAGREMLGWDIKRSLAGKSIPDIHPAEAFDTIKNIGIPAAIAKDIWQGETALNGPDGKQIPVSQVIMSHKNFKGEIEYLSTIMRDISVPKKTEQELRHLRNYLSNVFDSMPSVLVGVDADEKITQWNTEAMRATGLSVNEAVGQPLAQAFPHLLSEVDRIRKAMRTRETQVELKKASQKNGRTRYEDITIYPLISNGVEGAVIRVDDITEQIRLEEMMVQSEKMLSVGGLAAGMAHEINNPLAGMMQTADVMGSRLTNLEMPPNRKAAEEIGIRMEDIKAFMEKRGILRMVKTINESGQRVAEIVDNMLSFARKSNAAISTHNPVELLDQILALAATDYDLKKKYDFKAIEIVKEYEPDLPEVPCEGAKLQQVFLNILRNGAQAMQESMEKDSRHKPKFILRMAMERKTNMLQMEIEDNGPGMDKETCKRVFEPFYTTKPVGVGTGLGLSVSYFIITENHGGEMSVESTPGVGTKFIIRLPI